MYDPGEKTDFAPTEEAQQPIGEVEVTD